ncbi:MAG: hypothetical protein BGO26_20040 [Actinobacteria bacterium 69-20]|nr:YcaO-like family protein [Actinomycetota bacterium]OJV24808.1 MAG: hypothetical protein BGO26_20040 [Actinobacteria bacterium 69-20]
MNATMQRLPAFLKPFVGPTSIVRMVRTILNAPGEPRLFSVSSIPNSMELVAGAEMAGNTGGMGETWDAAAIGAVGECVERYCCAVQPADPVVASAAELGDAAVGMDAFQLFSERQYAHPNFPFARQDDQLPITWVAAERLSDHETRFVPACLVYIPYVPRLPGKTDMLALSVSSGQACHTDWDSAVLSGLCEVIERDAFMLTWARRLTPTRLRLDERLPLFDWFQRYFARASLTFDLFRLPSDIDVPTVLCVARGHTPDGPFACVGAACRLNEADAARKAVVEAAQGAVWVRDLIRTLPDWRPAPDFSNVRDFPDHVRLYGLPEMLPHLDFLYEGPDAELRDAPGPAGTGDAIAKVLGAVRTTGLEPLVCDLTTPDVADAGMRVARVLIPGAAELYAVHGLPTYGSERYRRVPGALGFVGEPYETFNPWPHPFP